MLSPSSPKSAASIPLLIHSPYGDWERQLRARLSDSLIRIRALNAAASTSEADPAVIDEGFRATIRRGPCPLALWDFDRDPLAAWRGLEHWLRLARGGLTLVLDPRRLPDLGVAARELGATQVWSGPAPPPRIAEILVSWGRLAVQRSSWVRDSDAAWSRDDEDFDLQVEDEDEI